MKFVLKRPGLWVQKVVKSYWKFEIEPSDLPYAQRYFPYGSFELIFYIQNPGVMDDWKGRHHVAQPDVCYSGQLTHSFRMNFEKACTCFGISMHPWAGNVLFDCPANEFTD